MKKMSNMANLDQNNNNKNEEKIDKIENKNFIPLLKGESSVSFKSSKESSINNNLQFVVFGINFTKDETKAYNDSLSSFNSFFLDFDNVLKLKEIFMVVGAIREENNFPCEVYEAEKKICY